MRVWYLPGAIKNRGFGCTIIDHMQWKFQHCVEVVSFVSRVDIFQS